MLNHEDIKRDPQRVLKTKSLMNKYNWDRIKYPSKIDNWKMFEKIMQQLVLMFYTLKKWKLVLLIFKKLTLIMKNK